MAITIPTNPTKNDKLGKPKKTPVKNAQKQPNTIVCFMSLLLEKVGLAIAEVKIPE